LITFVNPLETHDGEPYGPGYSYRMTYPEIGLIREVAASLSGRDVSGTPFFPQPLVEDAEGAALFAAAHRAIEADAGEPMAWANLGVALNRQGRFDDAIRAFERALEAETQSDDAVDSFVNFCNCLRDAGRMREASALYERSLATRPNVNAHGDYAFALLTVGRLLEGFREYEFRWLTNAFLRRYPQFDRPQWIGQDVRGKTVLLWVEQGFGDTIQFVRYARHVKALGATVLLLIREELAQVLQGCEGIDRLVSRDGPLPPFDFHCPLLSLPRAFATTLDTIPADVPYLKVQPQLADKWRARLAPSGKRRVGIVWAGSPSHPNDRNRSIALRELLPAIADERADIVSLQKGEATEQISSAGAQGIIDLSGELTDFADTVAAIEALDLVICVDTSVAHLAGALGKPTWVLLPNPADFRWLEEQIDSPWYPTARLFRQSEAGKWTAPLRELAQAFCEWLERPLPAALSESRRTVPNPPGETDAATWHRAGCSGVARSRVGLVQFFPELAIEGPSLAIYGESRQHQSDMAASLVASSAVVVESRAGVGAHSLALARAIGTNGLLFAYEPRPKFVRALRQNLAANGVFNASIMARDLGARPQPGKTTVRAQQDALVTGRVPETFDAIDTLDGLRLDRLDLIKLTDDVDAPALLAASEATIWRLRPRIYAAVPDAGSLHRLHEAARALGYRCWKHESAIFNAANFNRCATDVFLGRTVLALVAVPEEAEAPPAVAECREIV
jgi:tetratricopeptide (TPR) repeat protein